LSSRFRKRLEAVKSIQPQRRLAVSMQPLSDCLYELYRTREMPIRTPGISTSGCAPWLKSLRAVTPGHVIADHFHYEVVCLHLGKRPRLYGCDFAIHPFPHTSKLRGYSVDEARRIPAAVDSMLAVHAATGSSRFQVHEARWLRGHPQSFDLPEGRGLHSQREMTGDATPRTQGQAHVRVYSGQLRRWPSYSG